MQKTTGLVHQHREMHSDRLLLRPMSMADTQGMQECYGDAKTMEFWSHGPLEQVADVEALMREDIALAASGIGMAWAIVHKERHQTIGKCVLYAYHEQNRRAELGYVLNRKFWRGGVMSEALTALIDFAFYELHLHRLEADADDQNIASIAMLEKLGFQREGFLRDRWRVYGKWHQSVLLGLLKPDWQMRHL